MKNSIVITSVIYLCGALMLMGFSAKNYSLPENITGARIVLIGNVTRVDKDYVVMSVKKVIKGEVPQKEIEVAWDSKLVMEKIVPQYAIGDQYLLFANKSDVRYEPFGGGQGAKKLVGGEAEQYEAAIDTISKYEIAKSSEEIKGLLISMLKGNNPLLQKTALIDFIYFDRELKTRKAGIGEKVLGQDVVRLTKSSDRNIAGPATQVLGQIGGKDYIPALIELAGSEDEEVAITAAQALSHKTGFKKTVKRGVPVGERKKVQAEWQEWWGKNKDKAKIRR